MNTGESEFYAYDAQGRLSYVYNTEQKTTQHFGYDGARMVVAMDEYQALLWQSFQGPELDLILEFHTPSDAIIPLMDHRRSISGAWDMSNGLMEGIATYDEEGRLALYSNDEALECNEVGNPGVICSAPAGLPFGLNTKWRSPLTGFVNMHHRWYSPRMGEFLSHDPLGYIDSYNLFGFATFDPINGYDPFGLHNLDLVGKTVRDIDDKVRPTAKKIGETNEKAKNYMQDNTLPLCYQFPLACPGVIVWPYLAPTTADEVISDGLGTAAGLPAGPIAKAGAGAIGGVVKTAKKVPDIVRKIVKNIKKVSKKKPSVWSKKPTVRGNDIEAILAKTEYKKWYYVGKENNGYFPLVDFQKGQKLVSLKTVDTGGTTWIKKMKDHMEDLATRGAMVGEKPAEMILDLRVQPGGLQAAKDALSGSARGIELRIKEFK